MGPKRIRKYRTTEAIQRFWEEQIRVLQDKNPHLLPGQKGYVAGEDTPNPDYLEKLSAKERMQLQIQCMVKLQALLPTHEAEERVTEAEQKIMQLLQVIEEKAPYLLPGMSNDGTGDLH